VSRDFTDPQRAGLLRVVQALKAANLATTSLDAPEETLRALAEQAEALVAAMKPSCRPDGQWPFAPFSSDPIDLPFSPVSGRYNPTSPQSVLTTEGSDPKRVVALVRFSKLYEGPPTFVHGGWIAAMFDQLLGVSNHANQAGGLTASLTIQYKRPTPIDTDLRFVAWPERVDERKVLTRGQCFAGDELLTECEGVFVRMDALRARRIFGSKA